MKTCDDVKLTIEKRDKCFICGKNHKGEACFIGIDGTDIMGTCHEAKIAHVECIKNLDFRCSIDEFGEKMIYCKLTI